MRLQTLCFTPAQRHTEHSSRKHPSHTVGIIQLKTKQECVLGIWGVDVDENSCAASMLVGVGGTSLELCAFTCLFPLVFVQLKALLLTSAQPVWQLTVNVFDFICEYIQECLTAKTGHLSVQQHLGV